MANMYQQSFVPAEYYSIDVECVATGTDHNSRAVGQIALVDQYERVSGMCSVLTSPSCRPAGS